MSPQRINDFIGNLDLALVDAMARIDSNAKGVLFILDNKNKLVGSLTDGDIRRWILKSGSVMVSVAEVMNKNPKWLDREHASEALHVMKHNLITAIPILDEYGTLNDILLLSELENTNERKGDLSGVPVVIMAGGKGTRLYPYTKILPKPLVPIGDTPIVERIINCYTEFNIDKFFMTVNYKKAMIRSYFDDINRKYEIEYVEENIPLGTGGSIRLIEEKFYKPLFITNCDALILADYNDIYQYHISSKNDITIVSALKNFQVPYGVMHTGENGILESMEEKPKLSYFINTGMYVINPDVISLIPDNVMFHMTNLVERVMEIGGKVGTYPVSEDSFLDMGEFDEMKRMEEKLGIYSDKVK